MTSTAVTTTRKTAPKKPQDRQVSKSEQLQADAKPPVGAELLRPVTELRSGEMATAQADILDLFTALGVDMDAAQAGEEISIETGPDTLRVFGKLGALLEGYSVDPEAFADFDRGPGSATRMAELAMYYMGELGKSDGSAS